MTERQLKIVDRAVLLVWAVLSTATLTISTVLLVEATRSLVAEYWR